jgi:hypothetical protein
VRPRHLVAGIGLALGMLGGASAVAQTPTRGGAQNGNVHPTPPPVAIAARRTGPIALDGKLDEPDWRLGTPATDFRQSQPHEGEPATQRTDVRFLYDDDYLYIGARMFDTDGAAGIRTRLVRRDDEFDSDYIEIIFDTYHDHLSRVDFMTNPSGSKEDSYGPNGANLDQAWDAIWEVKTQVDSLGWTAEFRIPLSQLRFPVRDSAQTWGLQVWRQENRLNELSMWAFWRLNETGGPAKFGHLEGLQLTRAPGRVEVLPYTVGRETSLPGIDPADPFRRPHAYDARIGADFKYLVTSNLTLSGTVNPDFGQVEVDPAVVNLSAFETFYQEKRPFFVEGSGLFDFGYFNCFFCSNVSSPNLFYSRRIGRAPQGAGNAYARGDFADVPDNTRILGAGKLTGQVAPGWTLATLDAATARETARVDSAGQRLDVQVEPFTNYFVSRLSHDLPGGSFIRGMVTSVTRSLGDSTLRTQLNTHSEAAGLETMLWWGRRTWRLMANVAATQIAGSAADILAKEQSSARYFQRPDRRNGSNGLFSNAYDSSLTTMRGYEAYARVAKESGDWLWELSTNVTSPGFEANDVAFNSQADRIWMSTNLLRQWTKPTKLVRSSAFIVGGQQAYNYSHDLVDRQAQLFGQVQLLNYWTIAGFVMYRPPRLDDQLARGGPVLGRAELLFASLQVATDYRKPLALNTQPDYYCADTHCSWDVYLSATLKPAPNISLTLGPKYFYLNTGIQYVTSVADPTATAFYGRRYVFANMHQRTLSMDTRLNVTFTPELTLQLYVQPLIASAHYFDFKEFNRPRTLERSVYGVDMGTISAAGGTYTVDPDAAGPAPSFSFANPDFNYRSLRGSAVLRWEWRPGSTLYVAWTQTRSMAADVGNLDLRRDWRELIGTPPENVFLVKVNYWLGF